MVSFMEKETTQHLSQFTRRFFSGTLLSRISGMARDLSMAFAFGDHPSVAAFFVAFRFSNLLRRLLGEGPFQSAFIPHFEELRLQDPLRASLFFRRLAVFIALILLAIVALAEGGIALLLSSDSLTDATREVITLTGWLFPGIVFICLYGLNISLLNCHDSFFVPSVAPFICNLVWTSAALFLCNQEASIAMPVLAKWVVVGFMGQWLLTVPFTLKHVSSTLKEWLTFKIPKEAITLARSFTLGALGVGAVQINAFIDALFARHSDLSGPVYLWYAIRFEQLVLAIFGIACVSTIVPRLSRAIKAGEQENAQALFTFCHSRIWSVMLPCTFALLAL
jgi:putative peptidoglycan lipid II flippase